MMDRWRRIESLCHAALARPAGALASGSLAGRFLAVRRERPHRQLVSVPNWLEELKQALRQLH